MDPCYFCFESKHIYCPQHGTNHFLPPPRLAKDTTPLQRGIIRHLLIILDQSQSMLEKDLRPTRHLLTLRYLIDFVREYFEQNPISQLGIIGMRDGLAVRISDMSGNPEEHVAALSKLRESEPKGHPSLQNALDMARGALFHAPSHTTREVLLVFGAIYTVDPGDIMTTISALVSSRITCRVLGLSAEVAICRTLVTKTNPSLPATQTYSVALDEQHLRELILANCTPPPIAPDDAGGSGSLQPSALDAAGGTLLMMGFPSLSLSTSSTQNPFSSSSAEVATKTTSTMPSLCACHCTPTREGYLCPRCGAKACTLPTECRVCGLTLILSTHLARSYHHLFPLKNWKEVSWAEVREGDGQGQNACFGCLSPFPPLPKENKERDKGKRRQSAAGHVPRLTAQLSGNVVGGTESGQRAVNLSTGNAAVGSGNGISESGRYACTSCGTHFCIDCDLFCHGEVHNCPGCLGRPSAASEWPAAPLEEGAMEVDGVDAIDHANVAEQKKQEEQHAEDLEAYREILDLLAGSLG